MARGKPSWGDAPKWANHLAQDENGAWYWYDERPHPVDARLGPGFWDFQFTRAQWAGTTEVIGDWRNTLESRV